jgi:hypothetical protein
VIWWLLIAPVNAHLAEWTPATMPPDWERARAVCRIVGLAALVASLLAETPEETHEPVAMRLWRRVHA